MLISCTVLDCLLEVRNKSGDYPRPTPREGSAASSKGGEGGAHSRTSEQPKDMSGYTPGGQPLLAGGGGKRRKTESLLDIWSSRRIEKENARAPYAGQQTFGDVAKLYLNMDRKEEKKD